LGNAHPILIDRFGIAAVAAELGNFLLFPPEYKSLRKGKGEKEKEEKEKPFGKF
jgi:hypothetical protein